MSKVYTRTDILKTISTRRWTLNTNVYYKEIFNKKDSLKIVCSCGKPQTLPVRKLKKYVCPICKNKFENKFFTQRGIKICLLCEQPHKMKTQCCAICNKRVKDLDISIAKLLALKHRYGVKDVFRLMEDKPYLLKSKFDHKGVLLCKHEAKEEIKEKYKRSEYTKWESEIPLYIIRTMKHYPTRKLLTLSGNKSNPIIHYVCIKCGEEQAQLFSNISKGHNCSASKSSGQILVEKFLKENGIKYKTEFKTLKCINPITGRQLPYDVEISDKKVLIEIQGGQHLEFSIYFHGTEENFEYQKRKDSYKRRWAERQSYKLLYLYYTDFENDKYKGKILNMLE